jgi:hypothetical protein
VTKKDKEFIRRITDFSNLGGKTQEEVDKWANETWDYIKSDERFDDIRFSTHVQTFLRYMGHRIPEIRDRKRKVEYREAGQSA